VGRLWRNLPIRRGRQSKGGGTGCERRVNKNGGDHGKSTQRRIGKRDFTKKEREYILEPKDALRVDMVKRVGRPRTNTRKRSKKNTRFVGGGGGFGGDCWVGVGVLLVIGFCF